MRWILETTLGTPPMNNQKTFDIKGLIIITQLVFLATAWGIYRWESPLRNLLWDQKIMESLVSGWFGMTWERWAASAHLDHRLALTHGIMAILLLAGCLACLFARNYPKIGRALLAPAALVVLITALLQPLHRDFFAGHFASALIIVWTPWMLMADLETSRVKTGATTRMIIAVTLCGQGLSNLAIFNAPDISNLAALLPFRWELAPVILKTGGCVQILVGILVLIPAVGRPALFCAAILGLFAALGPLAAHYDSDFPGLWLQTHLHLALYKAPLVGAPLLLAYWESWSESP